MPALRSRHAAAPAGSTGSGLPQLRRQVQGPAVLPLRSRPRGRRPRRARPADVPALPDHRPGQPGRLHQVRPARGRSRSGRPAGRSARAAGPVPVAACSICGREAPCETSWPPASHGAGPASSDGPECSACGKTRPVHGGSLDQPLCLACTIPGRRVLARLPGLRAGSTNRPGRPCQRCALRQKLDGLLAAPRRHDQPGPAGTP